MVSSLGFLGFLRSPTPLVRLTTLLTLPLLAGCLSVHVGQGSPGFKSPDFKSKRTVKLEREHRAQSGLEATTVNGALQVTADQQQKVVTIEATLIAGGYTQKEADQRVADTKVHAYRNQQGDLIVKAEFPEKMISHDQASFKIVVPDTKRTSLQTTNGYIAVAGLEGPLRARTVNGTVKVSNHVGDAVVRTTNGSISLADHGGSVQVKTTNAAVLVDLKPDQKGPVRVQTVNGSVRLKVGRAFAGSISARTSNGLVRLKDDGGLVKSSPLKRNNAHFQFASPGEESSIRSVNGTITVFVEE